MGLAATSILTFEQTFGQDPEVKRLYESMFKAMTVGLPMDHILANWAHIGLKN